MRLVNKTKYPTKEVRQLIRVGAKGISLRNISVTVVPARLRVSGRAWLRSRRILIRLPGPDVFPKSGWRRHRSSPLNHDYQNWREALVALAAHEVCHLDIPDRFYREHSMQQVEMLCEAFEHKRLHEYRHVISGEAVQAALEGAAITLEVVPQTGLTLASPWEAAPC
jgi:hypothetical protein